jgi:hypothetical protein
MFRLVSNGCRPEERDLLKAICNKDTRLEFLDLPTQGVMPHGEALTWLQQLEDAAYFCYMDTDIFARGDFWAEFAPLLGEYDALFSAPPLWCPAHGRRMTPDWRWMCGQHAESSTGLCLGSSFFGIYDNQVLSTFIHETGITFQPYDWGQLPRWVQTELERFGLKMDFYDTGKVLNILLQSRGHKLLFRDTELLCHVGGMAALLTSGFDRLPLGPASPRFNLRWRTLRSRIGLLRRRMLTALGSATGLEAMVDARWRSPQYLQMLEDQLDVSVYICELLLSLSEGRDFDKPLRLEDPAVTRLVLDATEEIVKLWDAQAKPDRRGAKRPAAM